MILKLFNAGGFETERCSVRNSDFSFRRKAQVRTYLHINFIRPYLMQRRHLRGEGGNQNPTKAGIPPSLLRFLLCTPLPYPLTPTEPAFTVVLKFVHLTPMSCFV